MTSSNRAESATSAAPILAGAGLAPLTVLSSEKLLPAANDYPYDVVIYIGRFQPFHLGHLLMLLRALRKGALVVLVLGSDSDERTLKNPLLALERALTVSLSLPVDAAGRVVFAAVPDFQSNDDWVTAVREAVARRVPEAASRIALLGHFKDESSYYLNHFPDWTLESVERVNELDATAVRNVLFDADLSAEARFKQLQEMVPAGVATFLQDWVTTDDYERLAAGHRAARG